MFLTLLFFSSCFIFTHSYSYLNSQKLLYVKHIINNPNTSPHFLLVTRKILFKHYCRWTMNHLKTKNKILLKQIMIYDMERNAVHGLVKSVHSYRPTSSLVSCENNDFYDKIQLYDHSKKMGENTILEKIKQLFYGFDKQSLEPLRTSYYFSKFISFGNKSILKKNILNVYICHRVKRMIF